MPSKGWQPSDKARERWRAAWEQRRARLPGFWDRVDMSGQGCWPWTQGLTGAGYGQYQWRGVRYLAHRYAYEQTVGEIPDGLELDHLCRNPMCVRPSHLEAVTPQENQRRGMGFAGVNARKATCMRGHEFTVQLTGPRAGRRRCNECRNQRRAVERAA